MDLQLKIFTISEIVFIINKFDVFKPPCEPQKKKITSSDSMVERGKARKMANQNVKDEWEREREREGVLESESIE